MSHKRHLGSHTEKKDICWLSNSTPSFALLEIGPPVHCCGFTIYTHIDICVYIYMYTYIYIYVYVCVHIGMDTIRENMACACMTHSKRPVEHAQKSASFPKPKSHETFQTRSIHLIIWFASPICEKLMPETQNMEIPK